MKYAEIIRETATVVRDGWHRGSRGETADGLWTDALAPNCVKRCVVGALDYVFHTNGLSSDYHDGLVYDRSEAYLTIVHRLVDQEQIPVNNHAHVGRFSRIVAVTNWNDNMPPDTGAETIATALDKLADNWEEIPSDTDPTHA